MSIPLFPSLRPNIVSPFWCDLDPPVDEEAEIVELEREQREWKENIGESFSNSLPIGKTSNDVEEEDLDDVGDEEEEDESSSDADDMDDDDDVPGMFRIHDNLSPPPASGQAPGVIVATTDSPMLPDPEPDQDRATSDAHSNSSSSSGSSVMVSLSRLDAQNSAPAESVDTHVSTSRRPTRTIVGRHISAPLPGMSQQTVRVAYINTAGRPVYGGQLSSGPVSPTSRAYIDAALQSPTGEIQVDNPEGNEDNVSSDGPPGEASASPVSQSPARSFPGPVSDHLSQYHQMVAAGHIHPSASSAQIDNLIESVHQSQRVHAARVAEQQFVSALSESSPLNVAPATDTHTDSDNSNSEPLNT